MLALHVDHMAPSCLNESEQTALQTRLADSQKSKYAKSTAKVRGQALARNET